MTEGIPPNFDKSWPHSDVILLSDNAEGKKLYANKTVLSVFSSVMNAKFNGRLKERIRIHVDYEAMKEILRIIFQVNRDFTRGQPLYEPTRLMELYKAADFLDFPLIRKMCLEQIHSWPSADMAFAAMECDLHDILMLTLNRMDESNLKGFFNLSSTRSIFSKIDLTFVLQKLTGYNITERGVLHPTTLLSTVIPTEAMRIDLTMKWFACDVAFRTNNSDGKLLYANRGTLATVSPCFRELFFDENMVCMPLSQLKINDEPADCLIQSLGYEYATVKTILAITHHCITDDNPNSPIVYHPALLYDMYRVAADDRLNIPIVQKFCVAKLLKQGGYQSYEVAFKLNLDIQDKLMENMSNTELYAWVTKRDKWLTYLDGGKVVVISSSRSDPVFSLDILRKTVIERLMFYVAYGES